RTRARAGIIRAFLRPGLASFCGGRTMRPPMSDSATVKPLIPDAALDRLWRTARSFNDFTAQPVTDAELRTLYDLAKWGPTTANSQPGRVVFVRSAEAKERLKPALSGQNQKKVLG